MLEYVTDYCDNEEPDVYRMVIEHLAEAYCTARDFLHISDTEKAEEYNKHGMELYNILLENTGAENALTGYFLCCFWAALARLSREEYDSAEKFFTPVYIEIDKYYNDTEIPDSRKSNIGMLWVASNIMKKCLLGSDDPKSALPYLEETVNLVREWFNSVKEQKGSGPESVKTAKEKLQQALKQLSAFHKEYGNKDKAVQYKNELLSL